MKSGEKAFLAVVFALTLLLVVITGNPVFAGSKWTASGTAICTASDNQDHPTAISDGGGGAIIGWLDWRTPGAVCIYAQRVNSAGVAQWSNNGIAVCDYVSGKNSLKLVADGAGGAIFCWVDGRDGAEYGDIYAEKVDSNGAPQWSPVARDGAVVCQMISSVHSPEIISDNSGGCIITWDDTRSDNDDIYAQRLNASGTRLWVNPYVLGDYNGVPVCMDSADQRHPLLIKSGGATPGAIIVWDDDRNYATNNTDIYAQKIRDGDGSGVWSNNGVVACQYDDYQHAEAITSDGAGTGAILSWDDWRNGGGDEDVYAQSISESGNLGWNPNGVALCTIPGRQSLSSLCPDGSGGAIVCWIFYQDGPASRPYAQRVSSGGVPLWQANGVLIGASSSESWAPHVFPDGSGGFYVGWEYDSYCNRVAFQRLDATGQCLWPRDGGVIQTDSNLNAEISMTINTLGNPVVTWAKRVTEGIDQKRDIYAQAVDGSAVSSISPNSARQGDNLDVVITGSLTNFTNPSTSSFGDDIKVNSTTATDADHVTANITVAADARMGARDVNVATGSVAAFPLLGSFTVTKGPYAPPSVTLISPNKGRSNTTVTEVRLHGLMLSSETNVRLVKGGEGDIHASTIVVIYPCTDIECTFDLAGARPGLWDLLVSNPDGQSGIMRDAFTITEAEVLHPTWYLAEGSTDYGFFTYISMTNPNNAQVTARITFMEKNGQNDVGDITLPPLSQTQIDVESAIGNTDFSTKVECLEGKTIAVDRTMMWLGPEKTCPEAHSSIGVTSPDTTWYLPEGSSKWGFECWLLIQNPNDTYATCEIKYMVENESPVTVVKGVPAQSRKTFFMADDIGLKDASMKVTSDIPVIPERAMYRNNRREGHDSIGTTSPSLDYFLAEGTTGWGFTTYVLVQNPNPSPTEINITYMTTKGPNLQAPFTMPPESRKTIRVNDILPNEDLSTYLHGSQPIIAERAMYWGANTELGEACHDSIGLSSPHRVFYLPDGATNTGDPTVGEPDVETWTLVQNPNDTEVNIKVSYLLTEGRGNQEFTDTIPANSRKTYSMLDKVVDNGASIMVESLTEGKGIMVERAMYMFERGMGTDTIGGFSD